MKYEIIFVKHNVSSRLKGTKTIQLVISTQKPASMRLHLCLQYCQLAHLETAPSIRVLEQHMLPSRSYRNIYSVSKQMGVYVDCRLSTPKSTYGQWCALLLTSRSLHSAVTSHHFQGQGGHRIALVCKITCCSFSYCGKTDPDCYQSLWRQTVLMDLNELVSEFHSERISGEHVRC